MVISNSSNNNITSSYFNLVGKWENSLIHLNCPEIRRVATNIVIETILLQVYFGAINGRLQIKKENLEREINDKWRDERVSLCMYGSMEGVIYDIMT